MRTEGSVARHSSCLLVEGPFEYWTRIDGTTIVVDARKTLRRRGVLLAAVLLPLLTMTTVPEGLDNIGQWIDKMATICAVVIILLIVLGILWLLSVLSGRGGIRG